MRILVWGLGRPGLVCASSLAKLGHTVIGLDPDADKVAAVRAGRSPFVETGLAETIDEMTKQRRLTAAHPASEFVWESDISLVCVGTPPLADGTLDTRDVEAVAEAIAAGLRQSGCFHTIALRSTVPPGFTRTVFKTRLEAVSRLKTGVDFGLAMFPEFLREGSALIDFRESPLSVIGTSDRRSAEVLRNLWTRSGDDFIEVGFEEAEMLKLASNAFHGLKTGFANEIGRLCAAQRIDPATVMELICRDTRLNLSPAYLRPGFPFGGSCLSKDLQALLQLNSGVKLPILESVLPSNREHFELCLAAIRRMGVQRIGILGLTFKPGTDDLRQSPALQLAVQLQRENVSILAYDPDLPPSALSSSNREILKRTLANYEELLLPDIGMLIRSSELLIITQHRPEFASLSAFGPARLIVDLAHPGSTWTVG